MLPAAIAAHAWAGHRGDFERILGITGPDELADHVDHVLQHGERRDLSGGRYACWDQPSGTVVVVNPHAPDGGTAIIPDDGYDYFLRLR